MKNKAPKPQRQQPPLLSQIISVSKELNRDEKMALIKYLMIELNEPVLTSADVKVIVEQEVQKAFASAELRRQIATILK